MRGSQGTAAIAVREARTAAALELRTAGVPVQVLAARLGISRQRTYALIHGNQAVGPKATD